MEIVYKTDILPPVEHVVEVYRSAGLNRPLLDTARMQKMYAKSNLVVTAWAGETLIGVARSVTDFCYCCYLSDLAVRKEYQAKGIGKQLIAITKAQVGDETALLLLSAPGAMTYYPQAGFEKIENGFIIRRKG